MLLVFHVAKSGLPSFESPFYVPLNFIFMSFEHGVELFFGISGIVIFAAFKKSKSISIFMINRATRILPVLWVSITCIVFLSLFQTEKKIDTSFITIIANLFCLTPLFPFHLIHPAAWTLCYEFVFYCMFMIASIPRKLINRRLKMIVFISIAIFLLIWIPRSWCFVAGILIYVYHDKFKLNSRIFDYAGVFALLSLITWHFLNIYLEASNLDINTQLFNYAKIDDAILIQCIAFICASISLYGIFQGRGFLSKILLLKPVQFLGTISFSFYLWQTIVMAIVKYGMRLFPIPAYAGEWSQVIFFAMSLPPTILVSYLSQKYIEDNFTNMLRHRAKISPHKVIHA